MTTSTHVIQTSLEGAITQLRLTSGSPRLDAELILAHVLSVQRSYLLAYNDRVLSSEEQHRFQNLIMRRSNGEPIAYLIGKREFWSLPLTVTPATLIPRPETELLVELCLQENPQQEGINVCDLGTGSGAIALALAHERPHWYMLATDVSQEALSVAQHNAQLLGISNIVFAQSSWFNNLPQQKFQIVISNPPYVAANDPHLQSNGLPFEPRLALVSPGDSLAALREIAIHARSWLAHSGKIYLEHGYDQQPRLIELLTKLGYAEVKGHRDLNSVPRAVSAKMERT